MYQVLACPYACACNAVFRASNCLSIKLILRGRITTSRIPYQLCHYTHTHHKSHRHQANTPLPFPTSPPLYTAPPPLYTAPNPRCALYRDPLLPSSSSLHAHSGCHVCLGACLYVLTRVPGAPNWVARLGSPASPRLVPADVVACRAYRDPRGTDTPKS